ncbi:MAG TPA: hypothetical protein DCZ92_12665 [Elusimicrobia bacterium]|nr:MAG: hypothetical protein A2016_02595 [Elusimicrobia bacterium GWF2_62_30]HBA61640.1 hypothetical protein [Elusimicrobiota bacterium]
MEIKNAAVEKLKEIMKGRKAGACLRLSMAEGCCGPSLAMDIVEKPEKGDAEFEKNGLKLYIHKDAEIVLAKAVIDCDKNGDIMITGLPEHDHGHDHGHGGECGCGH